MVPMQGHRLEADSRYEDLALQARRRTLELPSTHYKISAKRPAERAFGGGFMRLVRTLVALVILATLTAGCADSDSESAGPPPRGFNRAHSSFDDYGSHYGYTDPNACWRSTSQAGCL